MPFSQTLDNGRIVKTETVSMAGNDDDQQSSEFVVPDGGAFGIMVNTSGQSLNNSVDVNLQAAPTSGGNFGQVEADTITSVDGNVGIGSYDVTSGVQAPVFRLNIDPSGSMSSEDIEVAIIFPADGYSVS